MFDDSWLVSESLAFYMSTNTFSNPAFDAQMGSSRAGLPSQRNRSSASPVVVGQQIPSAAIESQTSPSLGEPTMDRIDTGKLRENCRAICDSFVFAFKSKMFVWELNLKRRLRGIRAFTRKHLPWMFFLAKSTRNGHYENGQPPSAGAQMRPDHHLAGVRNRSGTDKFWRDVQPETRETLGMKQERILSRLEMAMQDKHRQEQSQQPQLFNMSWPQSTDQLRFVRPFQAARQDSASKGSGFSTLDPPSCDHFSAFPASGKTKGRSYGRGRRLASQTAKESGKRRACWRGTRQVADGQACTGSDKLCVVCYTNEPNIVTLPCKHHEICSDCFIEIIYTAVKRSQFPLKCVLCRQKVEKIRCSMKLILSVLDKNRTQP